MTGYNKLKGAIVIDDDEREILFPLREILLKKGSLAGFFGLVGKQSKANFKYILQNP